MVDTRTTIPNRRALLGLVLVAGLAGAGLLAMGGPRLVAALYAVDAAPVIQDVKAGRAVDDKALADALDALDRAAAWTDDSQTEAGRGVLLVARALAAPDPALRRRHLVAAEQAFVTSLGRSPAQGETWFRLAWLRQAAGNGPGAVEALRMSILAAGFAPSLMQPRLELGLRLLPLMGGAEREMLKRQIRLAWIGNPDHLVALTRTAAGAQLVNEALEGLSEDEMARYIAARGAQ